MPIQFQRKRPYTVSGPISCSDSGRYPTPPRFRSGHSRPLSHARTILKSNGIWTTILDNSEQFSMNT